MKRSDRLNSVIKLAERRQETMRSHFLMAQTQWQQGQDKLMQLESYLQDYAVSRAPQQGQRIDLGQLQSARYFMEKLHGALSVQRQEVARLSARVEAARNTWLQAQQYRQSLEKLQLQYRADEREAQSRREQKQLDEMAGISFARKLLNASTH